MTRITALQFSALCDAVKDCAASLRSCKPREISTEAGHLRSAVSDLCAAELVRDNPRLRARRSDLIQHASAALAARLA